MTVSPVKISNFLLQLGKKVQVKREKSQLSERKKSVLQGFRRKAKNKLETLMKKVMKYQV